MKVHRKRMSEVTLRYLPPAGLPDPVERVPGLSMERRIQTDGQIKITSEMLSILCGSPQFEQV